MNAGVPPTATNVVANRPQRGTFSVGIHRWACAIKSASSSYFYELDRANGSISDKAADIGMSP